MYVHVYRPLSTFAFVIAGDGFMAHYYPDVLTALRLGHADIPHVKDEKKLALEASGWLKNQLLKAAKSVSVASYQDRSACDTVVSISAGMAVYQDPLRFHPTKSM